MQNATHTRYTKSFSMLLVIIAYMLAYAFSAFSLRFMLTQAWHPLTKMALVSSVGVIVIFIFSRSFKNSSFFDAYWSVAPAMYLLYLIPLSGNDGYNFRPILAAVAIVIWSVRLTQNWMRHWHGVKHEDWRYIDLKKNGGIKAFFADFFGIHLFPAVILYTACLPLYPSIVDQQGELSVFELMAFALCLVAVAISLIADEQVRLFKRRVKIPGEFMKSGLWKYSRHPNYFGEWLFWVGIFLFGLSSNPSYWWTIIGIICMLAMFLFASVPMMDKRMKRRRPEYEAHTKKVSGFFPLPHK